MATVAIDYTPAIRQQAGIGRLIRGQIAALIAANPGLDLRLFVAGRVDEFARPAGTTASAYHASRRTQHGTAVAPPRHAVPRVQWFTAGRLTSGMLLILCLRREQARRKRLIHDLAFLFYPDAAMPSLHHYLNVVVPRSVRRADALIADSQHTANDLNEQWRVPPACITVVRSSRSRELPPGP